VRVSTSSTIRTADVALAYDEDVGGSSFLLFDTIEIDTFAGCSGPHDPPYPGKIS
jgi:hypothetical protein